MLSIYAKDKKNRDSFHEYQQERTHYTSFDEIPLPSSQKLKALRDSIQKEREDLALLEEALKAMSPIIQAMEAGVNSSPLFNTDESQQKRRDLKCYMDSCLGAIENLQLEAANLALEAYLARALTPRTSNDYGNTHSFKGFIGALYNINNKATISHIRFLSIKFLMEESIAKTPNIIANGYNKPLALEEIKARFIASRLEPVLQTEIINLFATMLVSEKSCSFFKPEHESIFSNGMAQLDKLMPIETKQLELLA